MMAQGIAHKLKQQLASMANFLKAQVTEQLLHARNNLFLIRSNDGSSWKILNLTSLPMGAVCVSHESASHGILYSALVCKLNPQNLFEPGNP